MQTSRNQTIELLAPAGSVEAFDAAIGEGADAVYLGLKTFNARLRTSNFAWSQFEAAVKTLHRHGKKIYVTVNTVFEQRESDRMFQLLKYLAAVGPDGLIVQDFGVAAMASECFPSLKLHASTQMNIASARGANLLSRKGFNRVVLSRELDLEEIKAVRENSSAELEVFVHGALCVSCSGLCLFSSYLGGKSANRGMCTQACRRRYRVGKAQTDISLDEKSIFDYSDVSDEGLAPEDGASGYFFSPSDLQLLDQVPALSDIGVSSLKIEGRMKSAEYVGTVVSAYRHLLDGLDGDREKALEEARLILQNDFARPKTQFYYNNAAPSDWLDPKQAGGTGIPLGAVLKIRGGGDDRQGFVRTEGVEPCQGDSARIHRSDDSDRKAVKLTAVYQDRGGWWIPLPEPFGEGDFVYLTQTRASSKRYQPVLPHDLAGFRRQPGREPAPELVLPRIEKSELEGFPEGLYVSVGRIEDLYILQSVRPARVLLSYTQSVAKKLLSGEPLPFSKKELIIVLDPFFPQREDERLTSEIPQLLEAGYQDFMVNNLGHLAFFRGTEARLIAGPYLYTFNTWAYSFVNSLGLSKIVTPFENSRQNLDRTVPSERRPGTFVTVFSYPALFRIRADLTPMYPFTSFSDSRGESFRLLSGRDGSLVVSEKPFSIVDKIPFLKESGFTRFLIDFNGAVLKKHEYKEIMEAAKRAEPLSGATRFNWKDGFYSPPEPGALGEGRRSAPREDGEEPRFEKPAFQKDERFSKGPRAEKSFSQGKGGPRSAGRFDRPGQGSGRPAPSGGKGRGPRKPGGKGR